MWNTKLCLGLFSRIGVDEEEQIRLFREVGFDGFFPNYQSREQIDQCRKTAEENGMIFQSVHAPYTTMDQMWEDDETAKDSIRLLTDCLHACAENNVPLMIAHAIIGFDKHTPTAEGLSHFETVVREAEACGVKIAFENTEGEEYLTALMNHFAGNSTVGFCWDSGHELCYNHGKDLLALYGDRLLGTHLNDNLGIRDYDGEISFIDDLHLVPFDGIACWEDIAARLAKHNFSRILTLELKINHASPAEYQQVPFPQYLRLVYRRAARIAAWVQRKGA